MSNSDSKRLVGLLGYPVAHSLSPAMHNEGFRELGINAEYILMPTPPTDLPAAVERLRDPKYLGANVTLPHKQAACALVDELSTLSSLMGVVNTIVNRDGKLIGDTTDPQGFLDAYFEAGHTLDGKSIAVLGSGGSARTIAFALVLMTNAQRITLVARNEKKSAALAAEIRNVSPGAKIDAISLDAYAAVRTQYDVVVNATPVGMHPHTQETPLPAHLLEPGQIVYDIVYNPEETRLLREAKVRGCKTVGGLGMLVHQGVLSFAEWTMRAITADVFREGIRRKRELEGVTP